MQSYSIAKFFKKNRHSTFFWLIYLLSLLLIGVGYISITPIFEGFDETAHFSSLRQISSTGIIPLYGTSYLDQFVIDFQGPIPYSSGTPPFDQGMVYAKFFKHPELIDHYLQAYRQDVPVSTFRPSHELNWQAQHPPLYYLLLAPLITLLENFSFTSQIFLLRLVSFFLALCGVALGLLAANQFRQIPEQNPALLGFLVYPIVLPMFFHEFSRIGNDSLCIFFTGLVSYLFALWFKDEHDMKKSIAIGITLGMGLLTKALFLPIISALVVFFSMRLWINRQKYLKQPWGLLQIFIPTVFLGGGWYVYNLIAFGELTGSNDAIILAHQGGLLAGLKENLSLYSFFRGVIAPFVSYSWAGTWSLARLPMFSQLPLLALGLWVFINYIQQLRHHNVSDTEWLSIWVFIFFVGGIFWHVLIGIAINGNGATPGWYLHILMPWVAPAIGIGIVDIFQNKKTRLLLMVLLLYAVLYHIMALWSQFAMYTGCASKGLNKYYVFSGNFFCLDQVTLLINRASVLGYPILAIFGFSGGAIMYLWLLTQVWKNRTTITG